MLCHINYSHRKTWLFYIIVMLELNVKYARVDLFPEVS